MVIIYKDSKQHNSVYLCRIIHVSKDMCILKVKKMENVLGRDTGSVAQVVFITNYQYT